jgi:hypothetical protein
MEEGRRGDRGDRRRLGKRESRLEEVRVGVRASDGACDMGVDTEDGKKRLLALKEETIAVVYDLGRLPS